MKLTTKQRDKMPPKEFALPGGRYPINDKAHAANAKARATQMEAKGKLSPGQKAEVDAKANKKLGESASPSHPRSHAEFEALGK